jgi:hypothetical protein
MDHLNLPDIFGDQISMMRFRFDKELQVRQETRRLGRIDQQIRLDRKSVV